MVDYCNVVVDVVGTLVALEAAFAAAVHAGYYIDRVALKGRVVDCTDFVEEALAVDMVDCTDLVVADTELAGEEEEVPAVDSCCILY